MSNHIITAEVVEGTLAKYKNQTETLAEFIGRSLVVIFKNQTEAEASSNNTSQSNGKGFTPGDAFEGGVTAKSYIKRTNSNQQPRLEDWQVAKWTKVSDTTGKARITKYWKQLDDAARRKAEAANNPVPAISFKGKNVVLTGTLSDYTREEASRLITTMGGWTGNTVTSRTHYLIVGDKPGSKLAEAKSKGVTIIDEQTFDALAKASGWK